jgi:hypothetical protein
MPAQDQTNLLSREESTAIKGSLILLIILGHNIAFVNFTDPWMVMVWLYTFHIHAFFLLPWLYLQKPLSLPRFRDLFLRFFIPFLLTGLAAALARHRLAFFTDRIWMQLPAAFFHGGAMHLQRLLGLQFLWFLPAIFFASCIRELYAAAKPPFRFSLLTLGALAAFRWVLPFPSPDHIFAYLFPALAYLFWGLVLRECIRRGFGSALFCILVLSAASAAFFLHYRHCIFPFRTGYPHTHLHRTVTIFMQAAFFLLLFHLRSVLSRRRWLLFLGRHSFLVYLAHPWFSYLSYAICQRLHLPLGLTFVLTMACTIGGASACAWILSRLPRLHSLLFPRTWPEWRQALLPGHAAKLQ